MTLRQILFLSINIIGGILVIGSYVYCIKTHGNADSLWGGVAVNIRKIYTASMLIATVSYFAFALYVMLKVESGYVFHVLLAIMLGASALWMPLTYAMIQSPATAIWIGIRVVLAVVALASLGILVSLLLISPKPAGVFYWSAVVGAVLFTLHTGVLDAILWPHLWGK